MGTAAHTSLLLSPAGNRFGIGRLRVTRGRGCRCGVDKRLFVICASYWSTYLPVIVRLALRAVIPDAVQFAISWTYISSAAVNGCLYIALHSSVRRELRRYLRRQLRRYMPRCRCCCRRPAVAATSTRPAANGDNRYGVCHVVTGTGRTAITRQAPVTLAMTSSRQPVPQQLPAVVS